MPESGVCARRRSARACAEETRERSALQCNGIKRRCRTRGRQVEVQHSHPDNRGVAEKRAISALGGRIIRIGKDGAWVVVRMHGARGIHASHGGIDRNKAGHRRHHHDQCHGGYSQPSHASMACCTTSHRLPPFRKPTRSRIFHACVAHKPRGRMLPARLHSRHPSWYVITSQSLKDGNSTLGYRPAPQPDGDAVASRQAFAVCHVPIESMSMRHGDNACFTRSNKAIT